MAGSHKDQLVVVNKGTPEEGVEAIGEGKNAIEEEKMLGVLISVS